MQLDGDPFLLRWCARALAVNPRAAVHCVTTAMMNHKVAILHYVQLDLPCQEHSVRICGAGYASSNGYVHAAHRAFDTYPSS